MAAQWHAHVAQGYDDPASCIGQPQLVGPDLGMGYEFDAEEFDINRSFAVVHLRDQNTQR